MDVEDNEEGEKEDDEEEEENGEKRALRSAAQWALVSLNDHVSMVTKHSTPPSSSTGFHCPLHQNRSSQVKDSSQSPLIEPFFNSCCLGTHHHSMRHPCLKRSMKRIRIQNYWVEKV